MTWAPTTCPDGDPVEYKAYVYVYGYYYTESAWVSGTRPPVRLSHRSGLAPRGWGEPCVDEPALTEL